MDASVLGDLLDPTGRGDVTLYRHVEQPARSFSYASFRGTAWQTAHLLRQYGVHQGARVGIVDASKDPGPRSQLREGREPGTPIPEVFLACFGAAMQGGVVRFDPPRSFECAALLCPAAWVDEYNPGPSGTVLGLGGPPNDPSVVHFEAEVWSETPVEPPESVSPEAPVLETPDQQYTHAEVLTAARELVERRDLEERDIVSIEAPLTDPGAVVGAIAPLLVGGTIQVGGSDPDFLIESGGLSLEGLNQTHSDERSSQA